MKWFKKFKKNFNFFVPDFFQLASIISQFLAAHLQQKTERRLKVLLCLLFRPILASGFSGFSSHFISEKVSNKSTNILTVYLFICKYKISVFVVSPFKTGSLAICLTSFLDDSQYKDIVLHAHFILKCKVTVISIVNSVIDLFLLLSPQEFKSFVGESILRWEDNKQIKDWRKYRNS